MGTPPLARQRPKASTQGNGMLSSYNDTACRTMRTSHDGLGHRTTLQASYDGPEHRTTLASCNGVHVVRCARRATPGALYDSSIARGRRPSYDENIARRAAALYERGILRCLTSVVRLQKHPTTRPESYEGGSCFETSNATQKACQKVIVYCWIVDGAEPPNTHPTYAIFSKVKLFYVNFARTEAAIW